MINIADLSAATVTLLRNNPTLSDVKEIERGEYANRDAARAPWIGVYRSDVSYEPRALGNHNRSWLATVTQKLIVQVYSGTGEAAEDELEDLVSRVMAALLGDLTLRNYVEMLRSLKIQYSYDETDGSSMDFQWAFITLTYEARTGV